MSVHIQIVAITAASIVLLVVLELVRRRRLIERYALLWLFSAAVLLSLAAWNAPLHRLSSLIGVKYQSNTLFVIAFAFVLLLLLHFSAVISRLSDQSKVLAQRHALLEERLRRQEEAVSSDSAVAHDRPADRQTV
jgi:hypothetical protein